LLASIGNEEESGAVDVRICLGGDGTILRGLRQSTGTDVPVFGINFGEVGFLAACDPDGTNLDESFMLAIDGTFDSLQMPSLVVGLEGSPEAFNDVWSEDRRHCLCSWQRRGWQGSLRWDGCLDSRWIDRI
jgi:NAD+ kinase